MRLLLDTQALLWFVGGSHELSNRARLAIEDPDNEVFVSVTSYWEIVIKFNIGKLKLPHAPDEWFAREVDRYAFWVAPIERDDVRELHRLGPPGEHRDPFDRLLAATARRRELTLVTRDRALPVTYGAEVLW